MPAPSAETFVFATQPQLCGVVRDAVVITDEPALKLLAVVMWTEGCHPPGNVHLVCDRNLMDDAMDDAWSDDQPGIACLHTVIDPSLWSPLRDVWLTLARKVT